MSARDPELSGFDRQSISAVYQWQALKAEPPILSRSVVSMLLDLTTSMKIETIEFFNAIDILVRTSTVCSRDMVPLFFAAIRLSVFWRRRKDLLSMSRSDIVRSLAARDLQVSDVMEAESDILSCLGCHVWRSYANVLEVVLFVVDTVFGHAAPKEGLRQLNNVCVDLGTVLSSSDVFPLKHRFSVWETALIVVLTSIMICTKTTDYFMVSKLVHDKLPVPSVAAEPLIEAVKCITLFLTN